PRLKQNCCMVVVLFKFHDAKVNNNLMIKSLKQIYHKNFISSESLLVTQNNGQTFISSANDDHFCILGLR
ncbi:MAG: hypothetical protein RLZZ463_781, partial [Bacteroidota bacterium]